MKKRTKVMIDLAFIVVAVALLPFSVKEKDILMIIIHLLVVVLSFYKILRNTECENVLAGEIFAAMYRDGLEIILSAKEKESPYIELAAWKDRLKICKELIKVNNMPDEYKESYVKRISKAEDDIEKILFSMGYTNKGFRDLYVNPELCKKANQEEVERGKEC